MKGACAPNPSGSSNDRLPFYSTIINCSAKTAMVLFNYDNLLYLKLLRISWSRPTSIQADHLTRLPVGSPLRCDTPPTPTSPATGLSREPPRSAQYCDGRPSNEAVKEKYLWHWPRGLMAFLFYLHSTCSALASIQVANESHAHFNRLGSSRRVSLLFQLKFKSLQSPRSQFVVRFMHRLSLYIRLEATWRYSLPVWFCCSLTYLSCCVKSQLIFKIQLF
jgi:hypothetical protein